jgi:hypothetical protein
MMEKDLLDLLEKMKRMKHNIRLYCLDDLVETCSDDCSLSLSQPVDSTFAVAAAAAAADAADQKNS